MTDGIYSRVSRELGVDPVDGQPVVAKFGQFGPYVQKGEGANKVYASLSKGQLIETITLEEALKLFQLPRNVGQYDGKDIIAKKGRFGPYIEYDGKNYTLPRGTDPVSVSLDSCIKLIESSLAKPAAQEELVRYEESDISVINGRYGPYIKHAGSNYKIPSGTEPSALTEDKCKEIIAGTTPSAHKFKRYKKK